MIAARRRVPAYLDVALGMVATVLCLYLLYQTGWAGWATGQPTITGWLAFAAIAAGFIGAVVDATRWEKSLWGLADALLSIFALFLVFLWGLQQNFWYTGQAPWYLALNGWLLVIILLLYSFAAVVNLMD